MKKKAVLCAVLILSVLLTVVLPATAEDGQKSITIQDSRGRSFELRIRQCLFNNDRTEFTVRIAGYNVINDGYMPTASGDVRNYIPFDIAIAWSSDNYVAPNVYKIAMDDQTTVSYRKKDGSPMEQPKYIIIAPKGTKITDGSYYVIAKNGFYSRKDLPEDEEQAAEATAPPAPKVTPVPKPTAVPTATPEPTAVPEHASPVSIEGLSWDMTLAQSQPIETRNTKTVNHKQRISLEREDDSKLIAKSLMRDYLTVSEKMGWIPFALETVNHPIHVGRKAGWEIAMVFSEDENQALLLLYEESEGTGRYLPLITGGMDKAVAFMEEIASDECYSVRLEKQFTIH